MNEDIVVQREVAPPPAFSPGVVERAHRLVQTPIRASSPLQLSLFAFGAGLLAGAIIKRARRKA